jgi:SnoaL-like domain
MNEKNAGETLEIARAYYRAWTTTKDFDAAASLLADDLETDLPVNTYDGKGEFVEAIRGFGGLVTRVQMLGETAAGNEAVLIYDLEMPPLGVLRVAEQLTLVDGRIAFIRQVHDTATMRAAGFAPALPEEGR